MIKQQGPSIQHGKLYQYSVINHNRKNMKNVYTCIAESLCCTEEINIVSQRYFNKMVLKKFQYPAFSASYSDKPNELVPYKVCKRHSGERQFVKKEDEARACSWQHGSSGVSGVDGMGIGGLGRQQGICPFRKSQNRPRLAMSFVPFPKTSYACISGENGIFSTQELRIPDTVYPAVFPLLQNDSQ